MKTKKLSYSLGNLEYIEILNDWRKCKGIVATKTETNMGLAERDYSKKCETPHRLMVVSGAPYPSDQFSRLVKIIRGRNF